MTSQVQTKDNYTELEEEQVVEYLMRHPEFFENNALLLSDIEIPHESGQAVSIIERQVSVLRDKNKQFEERLREMVDAVHENQRLHLSLLRLSANMFRAKDLDAVIAAINYELCEKLDADNAVIRLLSDDAGLAKQTLYLMSDDPQLELFGKLIEDQRIQCGRMTEEQINFLFGDDSKVASGAILPLINGKTFGFIGLGSQDELHYHPGMGTDYLKQLSELVSAAIVSRLD